MKFDLEFTPLAKEQYKELEDSRQMQRQLTAMKKALQLLQSNPGHPGLHTHKYESLTGPGQIDVFETYAENNRPAAYRIFWCYYPRNERTITILLIMPHP